MSSVCLSVRLSVTFRYRDRLEFLENNFTADYLKVYALADSNMGNLAQRDHPKIRAGCRKRAISVKWRKT